MILNYLGILAGLALLMYGADRFVEGATNIARSLGMSPLLIGLTIVGIATSAPEIFVGVMAALEGKTEIAIGNAIGSNIANIGLVLGLTAIFMPITITSQTLKREFFTMFLAILLAFALMCDQNLSDFDAILLLVGLVAATLFIILISKKTSKTDPLLNQFEDKLREKSNIGKPILLFFLGLGLLLGGANLLVECAVVVAKHFGLSDLIIGLTIIAIGTSLPELAASIAAVKKNEAGIAIGNVIGSNMFNMLAVIGIPSMIHATDFDRLVLLRDFPIMIGFSLLMGWMVFIHGSGKFDRSEGSVLLLSFIIYQYFLFSG